MPQKIIQFEGREHRFPADFTDADISAALSSQPKAASAPPKYESSMAGDFMTRIGDRVVGLGSMFTDPVGAVMGAMEPMVAPQVHAYKSVKRAIEQPIGATMADVAFDTAPYIMGIAPRGVLGAAKFVRHPIRTSAGWIVDAMQATPGAATAAAATPKRFNAGAPPRPGTSMFPEVEPVPAMGEAPPLPAVGRTNFPGPAATEPQRAMGKPLPLPPVGKINLGKAIEDVSKYEAGAPPPPGKTNFPVEAGQGTWQGVNPPPAPVKPTAAPQKFTVPPPRRIPTVEEAAVPSPVEVAGDYFKEGTPAHQVLMDTRAKYGNLINHLIKEGVTPNEVRALRGPKGEFTPVAQKQLDDWLKVAHPKSRGFNTVHFDDFFKNFTKAYGGE